MALSRKRSRDEELLRPPGVISGRSSPPISEGRSPKFLHIDESEDDSDDENKQQRPSIKCFLAPHSPQAFDNSVDYEAHYNQVHVNRCLTCHKNFPSDHFLTLHIAENHDPINEAKRERGDKTYACFVEGCEKICSAAGRRRLHCIDKHSFPKNYDFYIVNDGIDRRRSMLRSKSQRKRFQRRPKNGKSKNESGETSVDATPSDSSHVRMEDVTQALSALHFVPTSVKFGARARPGFSKKPAQS